MKSHPACEALHRENRQRNERDDDGDGGEMFLEIMALMILMMVQLKSIYRWYYFNDCDKAIDGEETDHFWWQLWSMGTAWWSAQSTHLNSKGSVCNSAYDILCNLGCISAGEGWKATWSPSNPPLCLTNEAIQAQRDEMTCPPLPHLKSVAKPEWEAKPPGIQFSPFPSTVYSISLDGIFDSFTVCVCFHMHVFFWFVFPKARNSRATSPIFKELFCENQAPGIPL